MSVTKEELTKKLQARLLEFKDEHDYAEFCGVSVGSLRRAVKGLCLPPAAVIHDLGYTKSQIYGKD